MTKMDKEIMKQMEQFQRDFPNATPREKREFLEYLITCSKCELTDDDPLGILSSYEGKFGKLNNEYEHTKFIEKLNNKKHWETDADVTIKDLLYRYTVEKLSEQYADIDIPPDVLDEYDEENEAWWDGCIKAHASPGTTNKTVKEQYVYAPDIDDKKYKWYRVTETGLVEAPDYIPPNDTK